MATRSESTYSHTGSRALAWKSATSARVPCGSSDSRYAREPAVSTSRDQRAAVPASPLNSIRSIVPRTARSWLPARQMLARASIAAQHSFGRAPYPTRSPRHQSSSGGSSSSAANTASRACRFPWMSETTAMRIGAESYRRRPGRLPQVGRRRLGKVPDPLGRLPLRPGVLERCDQFLHEARGGVDPCNDCARDVAFLDLVLDAGERQRELVTREADVREVRVRPRDVLRVEVNVEPALARLRLGLVLLVHAATILRGHGHEPPPPPHDPPGHRRRGDAGRRNHRIPPDPRRGVVPVVLSRLRHRDARRARHRADKRRCAGLLDSPRDRRSDDHRLRRCGYRRGHRRRGADRSAGRATKGEDDRTPARSLHHLRLRPRRPPRRGGVPAVRRAVRRARLPRGRGQRCARSRATC